MCWEGCFRSWALKCVLFSWWIFLHLKGFSFFFLILFFIDSLSIPHQASRSHSSFHPLASALCPCNTLPPRSNKTKCKKKNQKEVSYCGRCAVTQWVMRYKGFCFVSLCRAHPLCRSLPTCSGLQSPVFLYAAPSSQCPVLQTQAPWPLTRQLTQASRLYFSCCSLCCGLKITSLS